MPSSTFRWTENIEELRQAMTFGHGFYGEPYWQEEESFLVEKFSKQKKTKTLCLGSGFFREFNALTQITSELLVGIDIEEDILQAAKREIDLTQLKQVELIAGNMLALPIRKNVFDLVVILFQGLGNVTDQKAALDEMIRVCSHFGTMIISVWRNNEEITQFRIKQYALPNSEVKVESNNEFKKIVVYQNGVNVFSSLIFSINWFNHYFSYKKNVDIVSVTEGQYCSLIEVKKME